MRDRERERKREDLVKEGGERGVHMGSGRT
jgi:hypothetical protein